MNTLLLWLALFVVLSRLHHVTSQQLPTGTTGTETTASTKPEGCTMWESTPNTAAYNGQFYGWTTVSNCKAACLKSQTCVAVDAGPRGCVHHYNVSDLTATYSAPGVTHFVLDRSCPQATPPSTDSLLTTTGSSNVYSSCKEIRDLNNSSPSGKYTIRTVSGRLLDEVYCEMGLNGGGYTFINPKDLASLTNNEVQAMFTDKTNFLMRVRRADTTQPYGVLAQLPQYQNVPLKLGLNEYSGYAAPQNLGPLAANFLYFGFIPVSMARSRTQQGLRVNGRNMAFTNCDANPNSYIVLFPNFAEQTPTRYAFGTRFQFCINVFNSMRANFSGRVMPQEYFMFLETHWGGCGCYAQTDGRASVGGTLGVAIGFR